MCTLHTETVKVDLRKDHCATYATTVATFNRFSVYAHFQCYFLFYLDSLISFFFIETITVIIYH